MADPCKKCTGADCLIAKFEVPGGGVLFRDPNKKKMRFDKLEQGKLADCWFVASLSSYLFVRWPDAPDPDTEGKYNFMFCDGKKSYNVATDGQVCIDKNTNQIYGAKEINNLYYWPAVYEKAYAAFLESKSNPPNPPSILTYLNCDRGPFPCLAAISCQKKYDSLTSSFKTATDIFREIQQRTILMPDGKSETVTVPYVATTYIPSYSGLEPNHSYSLLGLYQSSDMFLILRDPLLAKKGVPVKEVSWMYRDWEDNIFKTILCDPQTSEGIFAITVEDFKDNFEGFGYVV